MKKILLLLFITVVYSCGDNEGEGGAVNDGIGIIDPSGALQDTTANQPWTPAVDTAKGQDRVDLQQRDSVELFTDTAKKR